MNTITGTAEQSAAPLFFRPGSNLRLVKSVVAAARTLTLRAAWLACLLAALQLHPLSAHAQVMCGFGQSVCGTACYEPVLGQHCDNGIVCGPGQSLCGRSCYTPSMGQRCDTGVVCGSGQMVCAGRCFNPADGQHCDQGIVCGPGQYACGRSCYTPAAGQQCNLTTTGGKAPHKDHDRKEDGRPYPPPRKR